jgi:hypothetical protein
MFSYPWNNEIRVSMSVKIDAEEIARLSPEQGFAT